MHTKNKRKRVNIETSPNRSTTLFDSFRSLDLSRTGHEIKRMDKPDCRKTSFHLCSFKIPLIDQVKNQLRRSTDLMNAHGKTTLLLHVQTQIMSVSSIKHCSTQTTCGYKNNKQYLDCQHIKLGLANPTKGA